MYISEKCYNLPKAISATLEAPEYRDKKIQQLKTGFEVVEFSDYLMGNAQEINRTVEISSAYSKHKKVSVIFSMPTHDFFFVEMITLLWRK